jgi:NAD+ kinase
MVLIVAEKNLISFIYNARLNSSKELALEIIEKLDLRETSWLSSAGDLASHEIELYNTRIAVIIGGDGTILRSTRILSPHGIPVVGVKMGKVGFMAELDPIEVFEKLPRFLDPENISAGSIRTESRMMLEANITSDNSNDSRMTIHALNDVTVGTSQTARLVELEAYINETHLTNYRADAIITSTATGSTGYALSAGGPIVFPEAELMILQPVAPHTGLRDGIVLSPSSTIRLNAMEGYQVSVSADGSIDSVLDPEEYVTITRSPHTTKFLREHQPDFFYTALKLRLGLAYRSQRSSENDKSSGS